MIIVKYYSINFVRKEDVFLVKDGPIAKAQGIGLGGHYIFLEQHDLIVRAEALDSIKDYLTKKYGLKVEIKTCYKEIEKAGFVVGELIAKPNFKRSDTIGDILKISPKYEDNLGIYANREGGEFITRREMINANAQKVIELMQKNLKLAPVDKVIFIKRIPEGYGVGELHAESGSAITSTGKYVYYWLEFKKEKGYYLDPFIVKEIETLNHVMAGIT